MVSQGSFLIIYHAPTPPAVPNYVYCTHGMIFPQQCLITPLSVTRLILRIGLNPGIIFICLPMISTFMTHIRQLLPFETTYTVVRNPAPQDSQDAYRKTPSVFSSIKPLMLFVLTALNPDIDLIRRYSE